MQRLFLQLSLKLISEGLGLAVTVCVTKDVLPHPKRRLAPAMGQDADSNVKKKSRDIAAVRRIVLWFHCHFLIERYEHYTKRITFPITSSPKGNDRSPENKHF